MFSQACFSSEQWCFQPTLFEALNQDFNDLVHRESFILEDETAIQSFLSATTTRHYTRLTIFAVAEAALLIFFVVALWFILKT